MKKIILACVLTFSAQASLMCTVAEKGIEVATETISTSLKCENPEAILADLREVTKIEEKCPSSDLSIFESFLTCKLISKGAATVIVERIPAEWECDADHSEDTIEKIVFQSCQYIANRK
ncbi:MAG: hypothetical protein BM556_00595 [Bacteriovorax sp. MedPE-SWde]|nr:MAG: hypothetical protein BM556_00595 [Bacteriovorax sp. MedPE-SWde]